MMMSPRSVLRRPCTTLPSLLTLLALASLQVADGYSSLAGSCDHAGVIHGMDRIKPQDGNGGYTVRLGNPGVNVPGATVPVIVEGAEPFKVRPARLLAWFSHHLPYRVPTPRTPPQWLQSLRHLSAHCGEQYLRGPT
jgi:hypothetical protein